MQGRVFFLFDLATQFFGLKIVPKRQLDHINLAAALCKVLGQTAIVSCPIAAVDWLPLSYRFAFYLLLASFGYFYLLLATFCYFLLLLASFG